MRYFDAHTHVQFAAFKDDADEVIKRAEETGVGMNVVGTQYDTSVAAVALAEKHNDVWATVGLHPIHTSKSFHDVKELGDGGKEFTSRGEQFDISNYERLAQNKKVIAIGECGLDYYRLDEATKKVQIENFVSQIELANRLQKPLMLHIRPSVASPSHKATEEHSKAMEGKNAYAEVLEILKNYAKVQGDVHFFAGNWEEAKQFLDLGFALSFTGVITFTHDYDEIIKNTPLDMILSETDAPYVAPVPHRGKRNEPSYVIEVVKKMAQIKGISDPEVQEQLLANAQRVFRFD